MHLRIDSVPRDMNKRFFTAVALLLAALVCARAQVAVPAVYANGSGNVCPGDGKAQPLYLTS